MDPFPDYQSHKALLKKFITDFTVGNQVKYMDILRSYIEHELNSIVIDIEDIAAIYSFNRRNNWRNNNDSK